MTASSLVYFAPMRRLGASRMRAVRQPVGMVRDRAVLDALAAHELARRVEEHLVGIDVAVVVRRRHGLRIEVVRARAERADHEAVALERLVHRRRLVDAPDDRLEVVDVERPRIEVAVPADDIERMMIEHQLVDRVVLLDQDRELALLVARLELLRPADVALRERRALEQLPVLVAVARRERARARGSPSPGTSTGRPARSSRQRCVMLRWITT